ncbi:MAG: glycosyltransferase family 4 protein [Chloroflexi bacterium]|nr:glycosyltransferase family 4 protein [Chloroflexota bacterium]
MRIGIDARLLYYQQAGIGQYTLRLVEALAQVDRENEYVLLQSRKDRSILVREPNFRRHALWTPPHHRFEQLALSLELAPVKVDVLHQPDFIPPWRRRCPAVVTIHDLGFLHYPETLTEASKRYYGQIHWAVKSAEQIIAVSECTKEDLARLTSAPESKVTVIYEAAGPQFHPIEDQSALKDAKARYGIVGDFILFVGTIEPRKNLSNLVRAYAYLIKEKARDQALPKLIIAGKRGWLFEEVFSLVEEWDLGYAIRFIGSVPAEDLPYLYNAARLFVYPSLYEGFGLPLLEAMSCGTPAVASDRSSLPEIAGDAALLVPPEDPEKMAQAIWQALTDEELRRELRQKGLAQAQGFSWERTAKQTIQVYQKAAGLAG